MPFQSRASFREEDDLDIATRVMQTVERQVESYRLSLIRVRALRKEIELDRDLDKRLRSSPEGMRDVLMERGIPEALAVGMAAEDFQSPDFGGKLGFWTWDCCCTGCCVTSCIGTNITNIAQEAVLPEAALSRRSAK